MNLFRGIASESTLRKNFFKGVIMRIESMIEDYMPPQQFGFRRNLGTQDALHVVIEIERSLATEGQTFAILIDCQKASDLAPRQGMVGAFKRAGVNGQLLKVIESFYHEDSLEVSIGRGVSVDIQQNRGTPQDDPLSCTGFSLLLAELPAEVIEQCRTGTIAMFADDIIILHRHRGQLQTMLDVVSDHLEERRRRNPIHGNKINSPLKGGHLQLNPQTRSTLNLTRQDHRQWIQASEAFIESSPNTTPEVRGSFVETESMISKSLPYLKELGISIVAEIKTSTESTFDTIQDPPPATAPPITANAQVPVRTLSAQAEGGPWCTSTQIEEARGAQSGHPTRPPDSPHVSHIAQMPLRG
ncbi:uncharacterized protein LOC108864406 [Galendromus occidentalis]|uniref:Uncharacterized protein LOC108864406 n=1 Tax=Galendromus occidentalis TaxID=34638 RepID=A0AAJ7L4L0_9ACAR|nr:uncharacterized protein LOC108864406 [Galendromus occidentalis]